MNAKPAPSNFGIVTLPIGNGRRVRIADGRRLQVLGGYGANSRTGDRPRPSPSGWLARLKKIAVRR
jgi:hypothetical protein